MKKGDKEAPIIVSACLAGVACRYDGEARSHQEVMQLVRQGHALPLCPEQLGGLSTPRLPAELKAGDVIDRNGKIITKNYLQGAQEALKLAKLAGAKQAILKNKSPMCGCGQIYDGTFSGKLIAGDGIFCQLLKQSGFKVSPEKN